VDMQINWTIYVSAKEKFEVLFPSQVIREHKGWFPDNGTSPGTIMHYSRIGTLLYQINVTRIKNVFGPPENYLELCLGKQLKSIAGAELEYDTLTIFKGYPALEYEMEIKFSKLKGVMVLVKNTLYNLFVVFLPGNETEFEKFVNSFEVVK
jgi:hypothetical protein